MPSVSVEVEVDVEDVLNSMSDDDLERALARRGKNLPRGPELDELYHAYRDGAKEKMDRLLRNLFWEQLGRVA